MTNLANTIAHEIAESTFIRNAALTIALAAVPVYMIARALVTL